MQKITPIVEALVAAKATPEMILAAVRAYEAEHGAEVEQGKEKARERWRRWKAKQPTTNVSKRLQPLANDSRERVTRVEDKTSSSDIEPQKKNSTPRAALEAVLDAEHADAVIQHRQRIRKPLTGHAAKLLAGKFAQCPDPNAAADTMIGNGWQGFEPDWITKPTARGSPAKSGGMGSAFGAIHEHLANGQANSDRSDGPPGAVVLSLPYRSAG